jgi:hypothetical protein
LASYKPKSMTRQILAITIVGLVLLLLPSSAHAAVFRHSCASPVGWVWAISVTEYHPASVHRSVGFMCAVTRLVIRDYFNHVPIRRVMDVDQLRCVSRDAGHEAASVTCHGTWREAAGRFSVYVHFRWGV